MQLLGSVMLISSLTIGQAKCRTQTELPERNTHTHSVRSVGTLCQGTIKCNKQKGKIGKLRKQMNTNTAMPICALIQRWLGYIFFLGIYFNVIFFFFCLDICWILFLLFAQTCSSALLKKERETSSGSWLTFVLSNAKRKHLWRIFSIGSFWNELRHVLVCHGDSHVVFLPYECD